MKLYIYIYKPMVTTGDPPMTPGSGPRHRLVVPGT